MPKRRSILLHGLRLVLFVPGALLWTYACNLGIAVLFSLRLHTQLASILDHSLAAERLNSAFDLGTLNEALHRLDYMAPSTGVTAYAGLPLYLLCYFVLVPGTLFCYRSEAPSRLPILVSSGISYFWRFFRITLLTGIVSAIILGPMIAISTVLSTRIDEGYVGVDALYRKLALVAVIFLVAALLRLYFDLVEVYAVQLSDQYRESGKQDRRIRRTLLPAWRAMRSNFARVYGSFLFLTLLGFAAVFLCGRVMAHMLAQPRVLPAFLIAQLGLFVMMATRFWQRGAETILACDFPMPMPLAAVEIFSEDSSELTHFPSDPQFDAQSGPQFDAQSDPEPAAPSLDQPDPAIYRHTVSGSRSSYRNPGPSAE